MLLFCSFLLKVVLSLIVCVFAIRVAIGAQIRRGAAWVKLVVLNLTAQSLPFVALVCAILAAGGNHLEVMRLLSTAEDASYPSHIIYVLGITWEEITKFLLLLLILRSVPSGVRSINSFLLAGIVFGLCEGLATFAVTVFTYDNADGGPSFKFLADIARVAASAFTVILVHSLLMLVYGYTPRWMTSMWTRVLAPLAIATSLHLSYNYYISTNPFLLEDGLPYLIQPAGFLVVAVLALFLRRIETASSGWAVASETLPFCRSKPL